MRTLSKILRVIDSISEWTGKIVSFAVLPLIAITVYHVIMRYAFHAPTPWAYEVGSFLFGSAWVLAGGYALVRGAHVKMELVYVRLSLRWRAILDLITAPLFFVFAGFLMWKGWELAMYSLSHLEHSTTTWAPPIYGVKMMIPLGAFLILLQGVAKFIRDLITATKGREAA